MKEMRRRFAALGGYARAATLTDEQREESARAAAQAHMDKLSFAERYDATAAARDARWPKRRRRKVATRGRTKKAR